MAIEPSYIVEQERFEQISGLSIDPRILQVSPQGHRLIVMINPPPTEYGGLILPQQWRDVEKAGSSWVVSCGPLVGAGCPHPGGPVIESPGDLLYAQVLHGEWTGRVIRADLLDRSTKSPYILMTDRDLWAIDYNPTDNTGD